jgi:ABC-type Na+ efflux pump permease subunit
MSKKEIEITDLTFNEDQNISPQIDQKTKEKINTIISLATQERDAIIALNIKAIKVCYDLLYQRSQTKTLTSAQELLDLSKFKNLSVLMVKLNRFINERGVWKLQKKKIGDHSFYSLIPKS